MGIIKHMPDNWYYPPVRYCSYLHSLILYEWVPWLSNHTYNGPVAPGITFLDCCKSLVCTKFIMQRPSYNEPWVKLNAQLYFHVLSGVSERRLHLSPFKSVSPNYLIMWPHHSLGPLKWPPSRVPRARGVGGGGRFLLGGMEFPFVESLPGAVSRETWWDSSGQASMLPSCW